MAFGAFRVRASIDTLGLWGLVEYCLLLCCEECVHHHEGVQPRLCLEAL